MCIRLLFINCGSWNKNKYVRKKMLCKFDSCACGWLNGKALSSDLYGNGFDAFSCLKNVSACNELYV